MLEGFKGEPEEDDGVEEAVQTMGPEDLQKRGKRDGGKGCIGGGGQGRGEVGQQEIPIREGERERVEKKSMRKGCWELQLSK